MKNWKPKDPIFVRSYAKIHLTYDLLPKDQTSGHPEISTLAQLVDLHDTICLRTIPRDTVELICSAHESDNETNLAFRAAQAVRQRFSRAIKSTGIQIEIIKKIPDTAGLGGPQSNAAAVILGIIRLFHIPATWRDFFDLANSIGPDVVFFLYGVVSQCDRRGEIVTPLKAVWPASMRWILIVIPSVKGYVSDSIYKDVRDGHRNQGIHTSAVREALENGKPFCAESLDNCLEVAVLERQGEIRKARDEMIRAGAQWARLSGKGPALYTMFSSLEDALNVKGKLDGQGYQVFITRPVNDKEIAFY